MADTRQRLIDGAFEALRRHGVAGVSARTIAAAANTNQALIFYHFGSVDALLVEACRTVADQRVGHYRERFAAVLDLRELLDVGRQLHEEDRAQGNVTVLAQLLAGAQGNPRLSEAVNAALRQWTAEIEQVLARLLKKSLLTDVVDPRSLAHAVSAGFIGLEIYEAADPEGTQAGLAALEQLGALLEIVDELGPSARRVLRAKIRAKQRP